MLLVCDAPPRPKGATRIHDARHYDRLGLKWLHYEGLARPGDYVVRADGAWRVSDCDSNRTRSESAPLPFGLDELEDLPTVVDFSYWHPKPYHGVAGRRNEAGRKVLEILIEADLPVGVYMTPRANQYFRVQESHQSTNGFRLVVVHDDLPQAPFVRWILVPSHHLSTLALSR